MRVTAPVGLILNPVLAGTVTFSGTRTVCNGNAKCNIICDVNSVQTTDGSVQTLYAWALADQRVTGIQAWIEGERNDVVDNKVVLATASIIRNGASVTVPGAFSPVVVGQSVNGILWNVTGGASGTNGIVQVQGTAGQTITWTINITRFETVN